MQLYCAVDPERVLCNMVLLEQYIKDFVGVLLAIFNYLQVIVQIWGQKL